MQFDGTMLVVLGELNERFWLLGIALRHLPPETNRFVPQPTPLEKEAEQPKRAPIGIVGGRCPPIGVCSRFPVVPSVKPSRYRQIGPCLHIHRTPRQGFGDRDEHAYK